MQLRFLEQLLRFLQAALQDCRSCTAQAFPRWRDGGRVAGYPLALDRSRPRRAVWLLVRGDLAMQPLQYRAERICVMFPGHGSLRCCGSAGGVPLGSGIRRAAGRLRDVRVPPGRPGLRCGHRLGGSLPRLCRLSLLRLSCGLFRPLLLRLARSLLRRLLLLRLACSLFRLLLLRLTRSLFRLLLLRLTRSLFRLLLLRLTRSLFRLLLLRLTRSLFRLLLLRLTRSLFRLLLLRLTRSLFRLLLLRLTRSLFRLLLLRPGLAQFLNRRLVLSLGLRRRGGGCRLLLLQLGDLRLIDVVLLPQPRQLLALLFGLAVQGSHGLIRSMQSCLQGVDLCLPRLLLLGPRLRLAVGLRLDHRRGSLADGGSRVGNGLGWRPCRRDECMFQTLPCPLHVAERHEEQQHDATHGGQTGKKEAYHLLCLSGLR